MTVIRAYVLSTALACPSGEVKATCPMFAIRKLPLEERLVQIDAMSDAELIHAYDNMMRCLRAEEQKRALSEREPCGRSPIT